MATSDKPPSPEQTRDHPSFQDGVDTDCKGADTSGGVVTETGPERCVSQRPSLSGTSRVSEVPMERTDLEVPGPSLWSKQCPAHVYQTHEADSGLIEEVGTQDRHVPRRYADSGKDTRGGTSAPGDNCKDPGSIGLRDQPGQEHHNADPETGIPGICSRFSQDDHLPSWTQVTCSEEASEENAERPGDSCSGPSKAPGNYGGSAPSHPPGPAVLSPVGEEEIASSEEGSQLPVPSGSHHRDEDGATMVGGGGMPPQWETLENQPVGCVYRIGCVQDGLGSILSRQVCRRTMDCRREGAQYQLPRITGGLLSLEVLCEDQRGVGPVTTRQHYGDCIRQQDGRHSLQAVVRPSSGDWEVVLGQENTGPCRTSAWSREHQSGLGVQTRGGIGGLDAGLPSLRAIEPITWPIHSGPVCLQDECTASPVLQLETRPRSLVSGRIHCFMGNPIPIYVSSIHSDLSVPEQNEVRAILRTSDCTSVAQSSLVPAAPETSTGLPNSVTTNGGHSNRPGRIQPPNGNGGSPSASRLDHLRRSYNAEGLSDRVIEILRKSWRSSTEAAYSSAWKQWDCWCLERGSDPISAPINTILEFLLHQYEAGKMYRTINTMRSAISMTHEEVDGVRVGQHALVTRFLKGIYNCRPPCPKYSCTRDVDIVLRYIENLPDNKDLSFQQLSHKLVMLMALANADRCSDLAALDLSYHSSVGNGERFRIPGLTKSRRKGPPLESFYSSFPEAPRLCPVATLHCYIERSKHLRCGSQGKDPLFISVRKPHKPVKPATIGHWIKAMMKAAGINTDMFSAHSTRGASTSKANTLGVSSADILKAANWSSTSTFCRFYHRPTHSVSFGRTVLRRQGTSPGELQTIP